MFARWLSLKLAALGYRVWSDVTKLLGGEDFWSDIEPVIRDSTVKFLYVLSRASNHKEGTLRELRVADAVRKIEGFKDFVIPLRIDDLPHSLINIEIGRLNAIEFAGSWATGLKHVCEKFAADAVPKNPSSGPDIVRQWWDREFAADTGVSDVPELHYSNWFPLRLPPRIYRYSAVGLVDREPKWSFPAIWQDYRLITFAPEEDVKAGLGTLRIQNIEELNTASFLLGESKQRQHHRNLVTEMVTDAWELFALSRGLRQFSMASERNAFYFDLDVLPVPNVSFISVEGEKTHRGLMGYKTRKKSGTRRHWHFAISARTAVHPHPMLQIRAHVLFSDDGRTIWASADAMHRARRSQCKAWWNDDWRDRILATMAWLAGGQIVLNLPLSASSANAVVDARPLEFLSPVTLREPSEKPDQKAIDEDDDAEDEDDSAEDADPARMRP